MSKAPTTPAGNGAPEKKAVIPMNTEAMEADRGELRDIKTQILREKRLLNDFQQQKEKIEQFWLMEKQTRDDLLMQLKNKLRQKQDLEEKHAFEIKVYKQKVKHLLHEQQGHITADVRIDGQVALKLLQDENRQVEHELKTNIRGIKVIKKHMELAHLDLKKSIKQEMEKEVMGLRQHYERLAEELKASYEKKMKTVRATSDAVRIADTTRIEKRKKNHINKLMTKHKGKFDEIKLYYRDITRANLDNIKQLKEDVESGKKKEKHLEKEVRELAREHTRLLKPLQKNKQYAEELKTQLQIFHQEAKALKATKSQLTELETHHKNLSWEHEILEQKFEQIKAEKKALEQKLQTTIYDIQQKTGFRNLVLEKKLEALSIDLQKTESALAEVIASTMQGEGQMEVKNSLEDVLMAKNQQVQRLERTLSELKQKYHDAIVKYENKLAEYNIPVQELGFTPVKRF